MLILELINMYILFSVRAQKYGWYIYNIYLLTETYRRLLLAFMPTSGPFC
jgi:hypothetical protein